MIYDEPPTRAAFVDAIAEAAPEPLLLMEVTDDLICDSAIPVPPATDGAGDRADT
jgi:hypothetical protein